MKSRKMCAFMPEAIALKCSLMLAVDHGRNKVCLESDALLLVTSINNKRLEMYDLRCWSILG